MTAAKVNNPVHVCAYCVLARREGAIVLTADAALAATPGSLRTAVIALTARPQPKRAHGLRPPTPSRQP